MGDLSQFIGKQVEVVVSGDKKCYGTIVDTGSDIIVVYNGETFLYIPVVHVQKIKLWSPRILAELQHAVDVPTDPPIDLESEKISYRKILMHARGRFVAIYVTGDKSIHGYLTSIMNNYFVFYSPVYKTMYVTLDHMKWLEPYSQNLTPYSLSNTLLPVNPAPLPLSRTFEEQCGKLVGNLVVFDLGDDQDKIGLVQHVQNNIIEVVIANGEKRYLNVRHLKTVHIP
ncbi:MAG: DUF2642 domain-containing protein [Tumebacillaceae bacterium]